MDYRTITVSLAAKKFIFEGMVFGNEFIAK